MKTARFLFLILLFSVAIRESALAAAFGPFPGLDTLIQRSDAIVVADILEQKSPFKEPRRGMHAGHDVYILKTIKGDVPEGKKMTLSLRFLPLGIIKGRTSPAQFYFGQRQIVFLERERRGYKSAYASLSYEAGHMEVSPVADVSRLKGTTPTAVITELLQGFVEFKRKELKRLERQVATVLAEE